MKEQKERNQEIYELSFHPAMNQGDIARYFGISKQAVSFIIKREQKRHQATQNQRERGVVAKAMAVIKSSFSRPSFWNRGK